jgi:hypothetical protein
MAGRSRASGRLDRPRPDRLWHPRWLDAAAIDLDVVALLPGRETVLDAETVRDLERAFVPGGEFETWRVN